MELRQGCRVSARSEFEDAHGYWNDSLDDLLNADPKYFAAYDRLLRVTQKRGNLTDAQRELICVAVNAQVTYLNEKHTRHHIREALKSGVTNEEIDETLQLSASLGIHSMLVGVPIAHEIFEELGVAVDAEKLDAHREALKQRFIDEKKYWSSHWDVVLAYSPEHFEAYLDLSGLAWTHGVLQPWFKELIYIAIDVATTHLFAPGIKTHTAQAIRYGATPDQVIDVMTLASNIGVHTTLMGITQIPAGTFEPTERKFPR
ncbi:carboxymuconolactone decarboxylase family protein [Brevibacterium sp. GP-SGM9]|uniref:carboxymuconolactone decarboxylase family protein n=1 Tax=unclassified Brevibacterium TaxID=2614124 RepID=UPI001E3BEC6D|nr:MULTISPECIES: carboxymuconolactone decarboxylase family protein [unclassified Brevibacterium]MCD1286084.1 carboxymuconolactone decarboxylase [Brevibacterium sp. CCUG 69071]MDK8433435.1 carboxymuconolactone decarboxylase family protein [Brevibacterium sp. H-BE7]